MSVIPHETTPAVRPRGWLLETAVVIALLAFGYFVLMLDTVPRPSSEPTLTEFEFAEPPA